VARDERGEPLLPARSAHSTLASHRAVAAIAAQIQCVEAFFARACAAQALGRDSINGAINGYTSSTAATRSP
jgi:hypothetical protein